MIDTPVVGGGFLSGPVGNREVFTDADFGESDLMYARTARDFVTKEVLPRLREIEEQQEGVMPSLLRRAGEIGLLMRDIPEYYGGWRASRASPRLDRSWI
jgi:alkylation response protein AidB-like acyl-CoA dehydrogenase